MNNMVKRTYEKTKDLPFQKDIIPGHGVGREFDELRKENKNLSKLSAYGDKLIQKFIKENAHRERTLRKKEDELWEYRHSKPPLSINPWKPANHVITEFSVPPGDKIHSFRVEKKKPYLIKEPFRIPKKDGDYFYDRKAKSKIVY